MPNEVTRQGVRNLDLMKRKVEVAPCQMVDGKYVGGMLSKWKKEGIYPNAALSGLTNLTLPGVRGRLRSASAWAATG